MSIDLVSKTLHQAWQNGITNEVSTIYITSPANYPPHSHNNIFHHVHVRGIQSQELQENYAKMISTLVMESIYALKQDEKRYSVTLLLAERKPSRLSHQ